MSTHVNLHLELEEVAADWIARFPHLTKRIMRALRLAKSGAVTYLSKDLYQVRGTFGVLYQVAPGYCECPDHEWRGGEVRCAHRFACGLLARVGALPGPGQITEREIAEEIQKDKVAERVAEEALKTPTIKVSQARLGEITREVAEEQKVLRRAHCGRIDLSARWNEFYTMLGSL